MVNGTQLVDGAYFMNSQSAITFTQAIYLYTKSSVLIWSLFFAFFIHVVVRYLVNRRKDPVPDQAANQPVATDGVKVACIVDPADERLIEVSLCHMRVPGHLGVTVIQIGQLDRSYGQGCRIFVNLSASDVDAFAQGNKDCLLIQSQLARVDTTHEGSNVVSTKPKESDLSEVLASLLRNGISTDGPISIVGHVSTRSLAHELVERGFSVTYSRSFDVGVNNVSEWIYMDGPHVAKTLVAISNSPCKAILGPNTPREVVDSLAREVQVSLAGRVYLVAYCDQDRFLTAPDVLADCLHVVNAIVADNAGLFSRYYVTVSGAKTLVIENGYGRCYSLGLFKYRPDLAQQWKPVVSIHRVPKLVE